MRLVDPDPDPGMPKLSTKNKNKRGNFMFEDLSDRLEASPGA
jgi:hypothetical protein